MAIPVIEITPQGNTLAISGRVLGISKGQINATLSIAKSDSNGRVQTSQSSMITLAANSEDTVATTSISVGDDATLTVTLELTSGDILIGSATTVIGTPAE